MPLLLLECDNDVFCICKPGSTQSPSSSFEQVPAFHSAPFLFQRPRSSALDTF